MRIHFLQNIDFSLRKATKSLKNFLMFEHKSGNF
jgi:hypothetical protein